MNRIILPAFSVIVLVMTACMGTREPANVYAAYVDTDFASAEEKVYLKASAEVGAAVGETFTALPGARGYGVRDVVGLADGGFLLIAVEPSDDGEHLVLARGAESGTTLWTEHIVLASGTKVDAAKLVALEKVSVPVLSVVSGPETVYLGLFGSGPAALRAENGNAVANYAMRTKHPGVPVRAGRLAGDSRAETLASLVYLAGDDQAAERQAPGVRGHLEALAGSTDVWAAQAAADLLTR